MGKLKYNDLMLMIEEYSEFKADIAAARAFVEAKQTQIADVRAQIDRYEDIAIYAGVVSDLYVKLRELEAELKQYQEILVQLESKTKGFEDRKKDTVEEIYEDNGLKME